MRIKHDYAHRPTKKKRIHESQVVEENDAYSELLLVCYVQALIMRAKSLSSLRYWLEPE